MCQLGPKIDQENSDGECMQHMIIPHMFISYIGLLGRSQSSQLAEPPWTDPGLKSGISVGELISTVKKKKKAQAMNELLNIFPNSSYARKKPPLSTFSK